MSDTRKRTTAIDEETGEYIEFIEWREGDSLQSKEQKVYFYDKMERYADKTDFVWLKYAYNEDYYSSIASSGCSLYQWTILTAPPLKPLPVYLSFSAWYSS